MESVRNLKTVATQETGPDIKHYYQVYAAGGIGNRDPNRFVVAWLRELVENHPDYENGLDSWQFRCKVKQDDHQDEPHQVLNLEIRFRQDWAFESMIASEVGAETWCGLVENNVDRAFHQVSKRLNQDEAVRWTTESNSAYGWGWIRDPDTGKPHLHGCWTLGDDHVEHLEG